jgi:hypothetical protein
MNLIKSKERVSSLGEVFTPDGIVNQMHSLLPKKKWGDPTLIYLEPTCGNGQFVVAAIEKKISCGLTPEQACNTVFGIDIMEDNINECRIRIIVFNNIFCADSLEYIQSGKWENKKFFFTDPTEHGNQKLNKEERAIIINKVKKWKKNGN